MQIKCMCPASAVPCDAVSRAALICSELFIVFMRSGFCLCANVYVDARHRRLNNRPELQNGIVICEDEAN